MTPYNGQIEILDRYIRVGFDVRVTEADEKCLFTVFEDQGSKYKRWNQENNLKLPDLTNLKNLFKPPGKKGDTPDFVKNYKDKRGKK